MRLAKPRASAECLECGEVFVQTRNDQQFCQGRCKSKHFRRVQNCKLEALESLLSHVTLRSAEAEFVA